jgi:ferredoxin--NADP+ reductase
VTVDVIEQLPTPFGLLRYGVAPDHPKIKSITSAMSRILESPQLRFLGNVAYGTDLLLSDLQRHYDATVLATGTPHGNRLPIPGGELPESETAAEVVSWYNAHPDRSVATPHAFRAREVGVLGAGNVALDIARMLVIDPDALVATDVPPHVLAAARANRATDVHVFARRGPADAKFTPVELRELGALTGVGIVVAPEDLAGLSEEACAELERRVRTNVAVLRDWASHPTANPRRVHFHFFHTPVEITGSGHVTGLVTRATNGPTTAATPLQAVVHAVGHRGRALEMLPFDATGGVIPHIDGRVTRPDGTVLPGVYVAGWIKRGPTGVIGTNRADAVATVASLLADLPALPKADEPDPVRVTALLQQRGVRYVTREAWSRLDEHEIALGLAEGRTRIKVFDRATMLAVSRGEAQAPP